MVGSSASADAVWLSLFGCRLVGGRSGNLDRLGDRRRRWRQSIRGGGCGAGAGAAGWVLAIDGIAPAAAAVDWRPRHGARDERKILRQRGRNPRHLLAAGGAGDADAGPVQRLFGHQVGNADFLEQFLHEQAVVAAIVGNDRAQRRRIHHQRSVRRDHRRKAGGETAEPALERIAPARRRSGRS